MNLLDATIISFHSFENSKLNLYEALYLRLIADGHN